MRLFAKPHTVVLMIAVILLAGLFTIALQFLPSGLLQSIIGPQKPPSRAEASTAAIIVERGHLRIGVRQDVPPFGYIDADNHLVGFDIDLADEITRRWLGDASAVEFVTVSAADRIPRLASGDVDLLFAAMPYKRERDAFIDFSQPYFVDGQTLLVRQADGIEQWAALDGKAVGAIQGTPTVVLLEQEATRLNITVSVLPYESYPQALAALTAGEVAAIAGDSITLNQLATATPGLVVVGPRLEREYYAAGVPQADSALRAMLNFTLQDMKTDGTYDRLYQKWFPADTPLAIAQSPGEWLYQRLDELPTEPVAGGPSHIETILNRRRLIAAVHDDFPPFSTVEADGQRMGFDIDIVREFARRWLGDPSAVEFVTGEPSEQVDRLVNEEVDLVASALVEQREWAERIDFSQTYLGEPVVSLPLTIGLPRNDSLYRELVNVTLQELKRDGTYDTIYQRWFGADAQEFDLAIIPGDAGYLLSSLNELASLPRVRSAGESTFERIRSRGNLLRVGVSADQAPFSTRNESAMTGFDVDLLQALAEQWQVDVEFVPVAPGERQQSLRSGTVDILAGGLQHTKDQEAELAFSQTYYMGGASLLSLPDAGIQSLNDLDGRVVAVLENTPLAAQLQALADASGLTITIQETASYEAARAALQQGGVTALLADSSAIAQLGTTGDAWGILRNILDATPYAFGVPAGDSYFGNLVNATLQQLKVTGRYDELYRKWFGTDTEPFALEVLPGTWPYTFADSPTNLDVPVRSKVEEIQQRGRLVAGVPFDLPPFGLATGSGEDATPTGFDIDILHEFAKRWLGDVGAIDFVSVTAANATQLLASGEIDLAAAVLPRRLNLEEASDLSQTYYRGQQALMVRSDSQLTSLAAINNTTLGVLQGAPAIEQMQLLANREGLSVNIQPYAELSAAIAALQANQVDGLIGLQPILEQLAASESGLVVLTGLFPAEAYAIAVPNFDKRFRDLVNFTLQEMQQDGTYMRITRRWLPNSGPTEIEIWPGISYLDLDLIPMVRVPAGEFTRGNLYGFPDERAETTLFLDEFYIDQYEVTNRQYAACVQAGRCALPKLPRSINFANYYGATEFGNYPVIWVSWQDAADYCAFRGKRLPTEAEWEKAARGPENLLYPWGTTEPTNETNFNYVIGDVSAVGSFAADRSGYGAYDMGGNVREWVADWYQWDYYLDAEQNNPLGPAEGVTRVLRGGSWNDVAIYVRATSRKNFLPESYDSNLGFRCATATFPPSTE
ncbi:MAG TPA: transporter substrate-binding domain-containing protein [Caldilineaceae bacterium]|nr:transporter substrate-binding domain-containing protein [Caldilineaceae bacterium]